MHPCAPFLYRVGCALDCLSWTTVWEQGNISVFPPGAQDFVFLLVVKDPKLSLLDEGFI